MFNWFSKKPPVCPIDDETRHWVDRRWDWMLTEFGLERLKQIQQILPKPEYFPDPYNGTDEDVQRMFERVCQYLELDPVTMVLHLYNEQKIAGIDNFQGTAGVYHEEDGKFHIWLEVSNLELPLALVATIVHELCHVFYWGRDE
jgi:hypothetical protein